MISKSIFRKTLLACLIFVFCCFLSSQVVFAEQKCGGVDTILLSCDDDATAGVPHLIKLIVDILSIGVGIVAVAAIAWVGIEYMNARDNPALATKAKTRFFQIVIGLGCYAVLYGFSSWLLPKGNTDTSGNNADSSSAIVNDTKTADSVNSPDKTVTEQNKTIVSEKSEDTGKKSNSAAASANAAKKNAAKSNASKTSGSEKASNNVRKKVTVSEKNRQNMAKMAANGTNVTIVGDSITCRTLNAGSFNKKFGKASIKCKPGKRTFNDDKVNGGTASSGGKSGKTIINSLIAKKQLREIVVVALGTNDRGSAALTVDSLQGLVDTINKDGRHSIYFLTNYNYHKKGDNGTFKKVNYTKNNNTFKKLQSNNNNVMVINWAGVVGTNPKKYMVDYVHPKKGVGTDLFADTIYRGLTAQ